MIGTAVDQNVTARFKRSTSDNGGGNSTAGSEFSKSLDAEEGSVATEEAYMTRACERARFFLAVAENASKNPLLLHHTAKKTEIADTLIVESPSTFGYYSQKSGSSGLSGSSGFVAGQRGDTNQNMSDK